MYTCTIRCNCHHLTDEIEFEVGTDTRTSKLIARRLVKLPAGTVSFESISEERLLGKVDCEPRMVSTPGASDGGKGNRVSVCECVCVCVRSSLCKVLCKVQVQCSLFKYRLH